MISAVEFLVYRYAALQGLDLSDDPVLSVSQHHQDRLQRIFRGRWRRASRAYHSIRLRASPYFGGTCPCHLVLHGWPYSLPSMSRSFHGLTFSPSLVQCCCPLSRILLPPTLSISCLEICHGTRPSCPVCGQRLLHRRRTYVAH